MYSSVYIVKQYKDEVGGRGVTDSCWPLWTSVLEHPNSPELLLAFTVAPFALFTCTSASGNFVTPLPPISTYNNTRISQSRPIITPSISSSSSSFPSSPHHAMSSGRPGEKVVHQDYIARIRYSNALPPPPNPPKLLDIPGTGLSGGQYTSAGYSSRLARDQPLNIEADAELGMPIDLIGIPGIFEGKEEGVYTLAAQCLCTISAPTDTAQPYLSDPMRKSSCILQTGRF